MGGLTMGLVHVPVVGETQSGDDYCVVDDGTSVLVAVVDGLGHGPEAATAAKAATGYVREHARLPLRALLEGCHQALVGTRGAVVGLARIDRATQRLGYIGLGNIEVRVVTSAKTHRPISHGGIAGHALRKPPVEEYPFVPGDLLIMHTDGISDRFELSALARRRDVQMLANQIALESGKMHDDQLLLILKDVP